MIPSPATEIFGAVLAQSKTLVDAAAYGVRAECFSDPYHSALWKALELHDATDDYGIMKRMASTGLSEVRCFDVLTEMRAHWNAGFQFEHACLTTYDRWRRDAAQAAGERYVKALVEGAEPDAALIEFQAAIAEADKIEDSSWQRSVSAYLDAIHNPDATRYVPTGVSGVDRLLGGGLGCGWLVMVMGSPKSGKTAFAVGSLMIPTVKAQRRTLFFSLEMSESMIVGRAIAAETGIPTTEHMSGKLEGYTLSELAKAADDIGAWGERRDLIVNTSSRSAAAIVAYAQREHRKRPLSLIVVDYHQLIRNGGDNRVEDLDLTCVEMKRLAVELNVPVVMLTQPTLAARRAEKRLSASDGKGTGGIEEHADLILAIYRSKPKIAKDGRPEPPELAEGIVNPAFEPTITDITITASRHTPTGDAPIPLEWSPNRAVFR